MNGCTQRSDAGPAELLTLKQAADLCSVSDRTLWEWSDFRITPAGLGLPGGGPGGLAGREDGQESMGLKAV